MRDALRETPDDPTAQALAFDARTEAEVTPWYHAQIALDRVRYAQVEAVREGREPPPPSDDLSRSAASLFATLIADPDLFRAALEYVGTITPIQDIVRRPDVAERIRAATESFGSTPPQMPGPDRKQLLEILA